MRAPGSEQPAVWTAADDVTRPWRSLGVVEAPPFDGYALLDSGRGRKLERFGAIVVDRPEPQALWQPTLSDAAWHAAHATFDGADDEDKGRWRQNRPVPEQWPVDLDGATMTCRLASFRHLGLFPEQRPHWHWMQTAIAAISRSRTEPARVLNLFGYTGAASLLAAAAGAHVTHVDASKQSVAWARRNQVASGLEDKPIRWIVDDASKFVAREVRRERLYDIILVDPPKFGRGPGNETWELFDDVTPLLGNCARLLPEAGPVALILTVYAIRASALAFGQVLHDQLDAHGGTYEVGELVLVPEKSAGLTGRAVPTSLFTRWQREIAAKDPAA